MATNRVKSKLGKLDKAASVCRILRAKTEKVWRSIIQIEQEPDSPSENWDMHILNGLNAHLSA